MSIHAISPQVSSALSVDKPARPDPHAARDAAHRDPVTGRSEQHRASRHADLTSLTALLGDVEARLASDPLAAVSLRSEYTGNQETAEAKQDRYRLELLAAADQFASQSLDITEARKNFGEDAERQTLVRAQFAADNREQAVVRRNFDQDSERQAFVSAQFVADNREQAVVRQDFDQDSERQTLVRAQFAADNREQAAVTEQFSQHRSVLLEARQADESGRS